VAKQTSDSIRDAVKRCLDRVSQGSTPLGVLAEFLGELKDAGWSYADRLAVDTAVRQMLKGIVGQGDYPTDIG
jgi:hypothetical protein